MADPIQLRGGAATEDPRLDRVVHFDQRSRSYPIRQLVEDRPPRGYTWRVTSYLDQGREGACVGYAWAHEGASRPAAIAGVTTTVAQRIYRRAQQLDPWPGEAYEGTSVLAGVKAAQERGWYGEYRWAFSIEDLVLALAYRGPAVLGSWWWSGMWNIDAGGFLRPTGRRVGGHAYLAKGVRIVKLRSAENHSWDNVDHDRSSIVIHNSWGTDWGNNGTARITLTDLATLLYDDGEACVPSVRHRPGTP